MERITQSHLEGVLKRINRVAGFENPKYSTVGAYTLDGAYSGWQLQQWVSTGGGVKSITSGYEPKRELYYQMHAFLMGMDAKKGTML